MRCNVFQYVRETMTMMRNMIRKDGNDEGKKIDVLFKIF